MIYQVSHIVTLLMYLQSHSSVFPMTSILKMSKNRGNLFLGGCSLVIYILGGTLIWLPMIETENS